MEFDVLSFISLDIKVKSLVSAAVFAVVILHVYFLITISSNEFLVEDTQCLCHNNADCVN